MYSSMTRSVGVVIALVLLGCEEGALRGDDVGIDDFTDDTDGQTDSESLGDVVVQDLFVDEDPTIPEAGATFDKRPLDVGDIPPDVLAIINEDIARRPRHIVGDNDLKAIPTTKQFPYSAVVKIYSWWSEFEYDYSRCTGSLIAADAVLTAAHCVYDEYLGNGKAYKVHVVPGEYHDGQSSKKPFGIASGKKLFYPREYVKMVENWYHSIPYDYAIIRLKSPFDAEKTGVLPYGVMPYPQGEKVVLNAYHGEIDDGRTMMTSQDKVRRVFDNGTFNHYCDLTPGASGGGMTGTGEWQDKIFGIVSTQSELSNGAKYNISTLITQETLEDINNWVAYLFWN